ncbi:hypothetical protein HJFPF1_01528 [Paramyrothecium foliicola]|nr:hypothetical protein HJFPF1_01528 [Paramyrothecium foliicola]
MAEKTIKDLNGKWVMAQPAVAPLPSATPAHAPPSQNKSLSDSVEPALALQGIGFLLRKTIGLATVSINVNQYDAPPKPPNTSNDIFTHIDIEQSASGLTSTQENRCLDNEYRDHTDWLFGSVRGQSRFVGVDELDDEHLKKGWLVEGEGKTLIYSHVESKDNGWTATQVWGFQTVNGERRHSRNLLVKKGKDRVEIRFVYDYSPRNSQDEATVAVRDDGKVLLPGALGNAAAEETLELLERRLHGDDAIGAALALEACHGGGQGIVGVDLAAVDEGLEVRDGDVAQEGARLAVDDGQVRVVALEGREKC